MGVLVGILAAGASSRMRGGDKLLEQVDGLPNLTRLARAALAEAGPDDRVAVALPPPGTLDARRRAALDDLPLTLVTVADAGDGMGRSIAALARAAGGFAGLMLVAGDMPGLGRAEIAAVLAAHRGAPDRICRGTDAAGTGGHPVLFPARHFAALAALSGDQGAKALLRAEPPLPVPLPGDAATLDLDTPEAWAAWRARPGP